MARHRIARFLMAAALLCACLLAVACDKYEPQSTEEEAAKYYQQKYGSDAKVDESHGLGNYALFGYSYGGMEYIMSDGVSVVYIDGDGMFYDNRQTNEIEPAACAYAEERLAEIPGALTPVDVVSVSSEPGYETYKGEGICWHTRYDGNIEAFLSQERPALILSSHSGGDTYADGRFWYEMAYDAAQDAGLEDAWLDLARYFSIRYVELAVVDRAAYQAAGEEGLTLFDDGLRYTVTFSEDGGRTRATQFKPVFVPLFEGATITSMTPGVTLREGDVRFEKLDDPGFYRCRLAGQAASHVGEISYFVRNDSANGITYVRGIDQTSPVCEPHENRNYVKLFDGETYYIGDANVIKPRVEIESVTSTKMRVRYYTYFKDQIKKAKVRVIGMAKQQDGSWTSTEFPSRIVSETPDGWICEVDIVKDAKPSNTLYFQFTYDDGKDVTVQIEKEVDLPI